MGNNPKPFERRTLIITFFQELFTGRLLTDEAYNALAFFSGLLMALISL